jgi:DNA (cytosine-5)-methyltransferase 1
MGGRKKPVAIDLFAGAGGLTLGLRQAGFRVVGAVELDSLAANAYRTNHPQVRVWERDIVKVPVAEVRRALGLRPGELDLLAACPPCQGFSTVRTLNGRRKVQDARNELPAQVLRFVRGLRPKTVMLENVPGLAKRRGFRALVRELSERGYDVEWDILNAVDHGVPQRRRRLILVAGRLAGPPSLAATGDERPSVRSAIESLQPPGRSGDPLHDITENRSSRIEALVKRVPKDGGSRADLGRRSQLECHRRCDGFKDVYGRMAWDAPAPTITGGCVNPSKGRFLHPEQDRAITLREAALLQGFPPGYYFPLTRGKFAAAELIGNALPPGFVRPHAEALRKYVMG